MHKGVLGSPLPSIMESRRYLITLQKYLVVLGWFMPFPGQCMAQSHISNDTKSALALMKPPRDIRVTLVTFGHGASMRLARTRIVLRPTGLWPWPHDSAGGCYARQGSPVGGSASCLVRRRCYEG